MPLPKALRLLRTKRLLLHQSLLVGVDLLQGFLCRWGRFLQVKR